MQYKDKNLLIMQDDDGEVRNVFVFDTEEECIKKMHEEFNAYRKYYGGQGYVEDSVNTTEGERWCYLYFKNGPSFFWNLNVSE